MDTVVQYDISKGAFEAYISGENANNLNVAYPDIYYAAKTALFDWANIGTEWDQLQKGTIGNGYFPEFRVSLMQLQQGNWQVFTNVITDKPTGDSIPTDADQVAVTVAHSSGLGVADYDWSVSDTNGTRMDSIDGSGLHIVTLVQGTNRLGVEIDATPVGMVPNNTWAGFAWLTVNCTNQGWVFTTLAGQPNASGWLDGAAGNAVFNYPGGVAVDQASNAYVPDGSNNVIRLISRTGDVTTIAGQLGVAGSKDGIGTSALFNNPCGIAVDNATNVYVADTLNHTIRKITRFGVGWWVTTLAGTAGVNSYQEGTGADALFDHPNGLAVDGSGNVYVADTGNCAIRKVTSAGVVATLAGAAFWWGGMAGYADGSGSAALFGYPNGLAVDRAGNVYVADSCNDAIRRVTPRGLVTTLGGVASAWSYANGFPLNYQLTYGNVDGRGTNAVFYYPNGIAVDAANNLYISDSYNQTIRKGHR